MKKAAPLLAAVVLACASRSGTLDPRFVTLHNALTANGQAQVGPIQRGSLREGGEQKFPLALGEGCSNVIALGEKGVRDLSAMVLDESGEVIAEDKTHDPQAALKVCVEKEGKYTLRIRMAQGAGEFYAATWSGAVRGGNVSESSHGGEPSMGSLGSCGSPIPLAVGTVRGNTKKGASEQEGSCARGEADELVYRISVDKPKKLLVDVDAKFESVLYLRKGTCEDGEEVACHGDATSVREKVISEFLEPGTYFLFVDAYNQSGTFSLNVKLEDAPSLKELCSAAEVIVPNTPKQATLEPDHNLTSEKCEQVDLYGAEDMYRLSVPSKSRVRVRMSVPNQDFSPAVFVRSECSERSSTKVCGFTGPIQGEASVFKTLEPGNYAIFAGTEMKGTGGQYSLAVDMVPDPPPAGSTGDTCTAPLDLKPGRVKFDTLSASDDLVPSCLHGVKDSPENVYKFSVSKKTKLHVQPPRGQSGRVTFALYGGKCGNEPDEMSCQEDSVEQMLSPGTYYLVAETPLDANNNASTLSEYDVALHPVSVQEAACKSLEAVKVGNTLKGTTKGSTDKFDTSCGESTSPDKIYKLSITDSGYYVLLLSTDGWNGALAIRTQCADTDSVAQREFNCAQSYVAGPAATAMAGSPVNLTERLDPGTYYVVVKGLSAADAGPFELSITEHGGARPYRKKRYGPKP